MTADANMKVIGDVLRMALEKRHGWQDAVRRAIAFIDLGATLTVPYSGRSIPLLLAMRDLCNGSAPAAVPAVPALDRIKRFRASAILASVSSDWASRAETATVENMHWEAFDGAVDVMLQLVAEASGELDRLTQLIGGDA
jgi:hypothetical protein